MPSVSSIGSTYIMSSAVHDSVEILARTNAPQIVTDASPRMSSQPFMNALRPQSNIPETPHRPPLCSGSPTALRTPVRRNSDLGVIMFITPELGKWSTFGGLGVMVDDLINTMSTLLVSGSKSSSKNINDFRESSSPSSEKSSQTSSQIWVCSPYYERNRKGEMGYLSKDNINWTFNIEVDIGIERVTVGVYEGVINNVRHFFLHQATYFPYLYPDFSPIMTTAFLTLMAKCPLEICCQLGVFPSTIVTNDWATGLTAAYAKNNYFGSVFGKSKFMHIVHNLDISYEGRIYPNRYEDLGKVHMLPTDLLVDPHWNRYCVNPSRCAILCSDNWGTVSVSYRRELLEESPLSSLLRRHAHPFAHPNGIPLEGRLARLGATNCKSHWEAKEVIQKRYFANNLEANIHNTMLLCFVGRITAQKGVHLILDVVELLFSTVEEKSTSGIQILIGGMVNAGESYSAQCAVRMKELNKKYPNNFWSDPDSFFVDGPLVNLGADFGLMPSAFEPGGIVQQEFFIAGTPVIAFKTGGLRDTVFEFYDNNNGNGFTFESHSAGDFLNAINRAKSLFFTDSDGYLKIRSNGRDSVITCEMVAKAWLAEFYRMHNKKFFSDIDQSPLVIEGIRKIPKDHATRFNPSIGFQQYEFGSSFEQHDEDSRIGSIRPIDSQCDIFNVVSPKNGMSISGNAKNNEISLALARITFKPPAHIRPPPNFVLLAGAFDNWASRIPLRWDNASNAFLVNVRVPVGEWQIKFLADGNWVCSELYPTETDSQGNLNNLVSVK